MTGSSRHTMLKLQRFLSAPQEIRPTPKSYAQIRLDFLHVEFIFITVNSMKRRIFSTVTMAVATSFALAACSSPDEDATSAQETTSTSEANDHDHDGHDHDGPDADDADLTEVSSLPQRVVLSHDKGLTTIDPSLSLIHI